MMARFLAVARWAMRLRRAAWAYRRAFLRGRANV